MALMSTQSDDLRTHFREGAIYRGRANNFIRLLSICGDLRIAMCRIAARRQLMLFVLSRTGTGAMRHDEHLNH